MMARPERSRRVRGVAETVLAGILAFLIMFGLTVVIAYLRQLVQG